MTPITALGSRYGIQGALGRSVKRAAVGGTWWDLNGAITSCVAAYQAKGAASYAASKVNLANPGTYDATDGTAYPTWDASYGWKGNGSTQYLDTGLAPSATPTIIVRFSDNTDAYNPLVMSRNSGFQSMVIAGWTGPTAMLYTYGSGVNVRAVPGLKASGVAALALRAIYFDGTSPGDVSTAGSAPTANYQIMGQPTWLFAVAKIQAVAIYNAVLTPTQVSNLTTAMAAL